MHVSFTVKAIYVNLNELNYLKSECITFSSNYVSHVIFPFCGALALFVKQAMRDLGVIVDSTLKFDTD